MAQYRRQVNYHTEYDTFEELLTGCEERKKLKQVRIEAWLGVTRDYKTNGQPFKIFKNNFTGGKITITHCNGKKVWGDIEVLHEDVGEYHGDHIFFDGIDSPEALELMIDDRVRRLADELVNLDKYGKALPLLKDGIEWAIDILRNAIKTAEAHGFQWDVRDYILNNVDCELGNTRR